MISLRLDPELDARVREAAAARGESVSEFIRRAAADRAATTVPTKNALELYNEIIGEPLHGTGGVARRTGEAFADLLMEKHTKKKRRTAS